MKCTVVFLFLFLTTAAPEAYAHPPSDIKISFDPEAKMVKAVIMHDVKDPTRHFIKKVDAGLNGKEIISQDISQQDSNESQIVSYPLPDAKAGDKISVEGYCSISGKLKKVLQVE